MQQINFYQTTESLMDKTIFTLIEKCYLADLKVIVLANNPEITEHINKLLWTFAQKKFIPHGSDQDEFPEKQPIYISYKLDNVNKAQILVIINQNPEIINSKQIKEFTKILIIYDKENNSSVINNSSLSFAKSDAIEVNYYTQNDNGIWSSTKT